MTGIHLLTKPRVLTFKRSVHCMEKLSVYKVDRLSAGRCYQAVQILCFDVQQELPDARSDVQPGMTAATMR
jgi:hypothetical protein